MRIMMNHDSIFPADAWYPIEISQRIRAGVITQAFLHGQELALWRNSAGQVMVWENRCPHRSVRLTLGRIVDDQLACGYHGWRYGNDGACRYIPAHPSSQPPRNACVKTYPVVEAHGVIWSSVGTPSGGIAPAGGTFCRSYVRSCDMASIVSRAAEAGFQLSAPGVLSANGTDDMPGCTLLMAPMREDQCVFHLWVDGTPSLADLRTWNHRVKTLLKVARPVADAAPAALLWGAHHLSTWGNHESR
jgi:nitrite reductase/ring-hydroxylating ferredoxin subunit